MLVSPRLKKRDCTLSCCHSPPLRMPRMPISGYPFSWIPIPGMLILQDSYSPGPVPAIFQDPHSRDPHLPGSSSSRTPISRCPHLPGPPCPRSPSPRSPSPGTPISRDPHLPDPHPGLSRTRAHRRALPPPGGAAACPPCLRALVGTAPAPPPRRRSRAAGAPGLCLRKNKMAARSVCRAGSAAGRALLWGPRPSVSHRAPRGQRGGEPGRASGGSAVWSGCRARLCPGREGHGDAAGRCGAVRAGRGGDSGGCPCHCHCHPLRGLPQSRCPLSAAVPGCDLFLLCFSHLFKPLSSRRCRGE